MIIENLNPHSLDWTQIPIEKILGERGVALVKIQQVGNIKFRMVEYSKAYAADHWCEKGHIVHILFGELIIEYKDRPAHTIKQDTTYVIGNNTTVHKVRSDDGATALIID